MALMEQISENFNNYHKTSLKKYFPIQKIESFFKWSLNEKILGYLWIIIVHILLGDSPEEQSVFKKIREIPEEFNQEILGNFI